MTAHILGLHHVTATVDDAQSDLDFGIDELFFRDLGSVPGAAPGRMSPYSAVALVGLGVALSVFHSPLLRPLRHSSQSTRTGPSLPRRTS